MSSFEKFDPMHLAPLTAADLAILPDELPSGPVLYELDDGRLVTLPLPGFQHGHVIAVIGSMMIEAGDRRGLGRTTCGGSGIVLRRNPDRVVGVDVAFVAKGSLPLKLSPEGYLETMPDLVVEVLSKSNTAGYVRRKIEDYLQAGVRLVWIVDPAGRTLVEHRSQTEPRTYTAADIVTAEEVLPGLRLALAEVFSALE